MSDEPTSGVEAVLRQVLQMAIDHDCLDGDPHVRELALAALATPAADALKAALLDCIASGAETQGISGEPLPDGRCASIYFAKHDRDRSIRLVPIAPPASPATSGRVCEICKGPHDNDALSDICRHCEETAPWREPPASPSPAPAAVDWRDDPSADEHWNAGCDFAMTQLCRYLKVDPAVVSWDAATETLDGDVSAIIGNILRAHFGEEWGPDAPAPAAVEELIRRLKLPTGVRGYNSEDSYEVYDPIRLEAATALSTLAADKARVEAERDRADDAREAHAKCTTALIEAAEARASALEGEVERLKEAQAAGRDRCAEIVEEWSQTQTMKLHAGEMTVGEIRTAKAILNGLAAAIRKETP